MPDDFVVATGESYTVKDFVNMAAQSLAMKLEWQGEGSEETAILTGTNKIIVKVDPLYFRPTDVQSLLGDSSKIRSELKWHPRTSFAELVDEMVKSDYDRESRKHAR